MPPVLTARDVLEQLDDDARREAAFFPDFGHGYYYHVDQRLTAYGDDSRWVIVIEHLAVNPRATGLPQTTLYYHGNAVVLPPQPGWGEQAVQSVHTVEDGPGGPLLDKDYMDEVNLAATDVRIRGEVVPIRTDPNYYWARNIDVESVTHEEIDAIIRELRAALPPEHAAEQIRYREEDLRPRVGQFHLRTWHLARGLVPEHRDLLLATEAERRLGVPADVPMLLQIDEWVHPKLLLEEERPSDCESFKLIARVLAKRDPKEYRPTEPPNTHWSHWPESGSL